MSSIMEKMMTEYAEDYQRAKEIVENANPEELAVEYA